MNLYRMRFPGMRLQSIELWLFMSRSLPECPSDKYEEDYNELVANGNPNYCLMDQKLVSVAGGPKKIEACDIFDKDKKFIHVKKRTISSVKSFICTRQDCCGVFYK